MPRGATWVFGCAGLPHSARILHPVLGPRAGAGPSGVTWSCGWQRNDGAVRFLCARRQQNPSPDVDLGRQTPFVPGRLWAFAHCTGLCQVTGVF